MPFVLHRQLAIPGLQAKGWPLRAQLLPVSAIEHVANTIVKFDVKAAIRGEVGALHAAQEELTGFADDWAKKAWLEVDWTKIKDLTFLEALEARKTEIAKCDSWVCATCPNLKRHFAMAHEIHQLNENIFLLKQLISDQNLQLLPDYEQRVTVLKELGFIDENCSVQLKGRVACEVNSAHELVLTELILENFLAEYEPEEIVALLSAFVFQEKTDTVPTITPRLEKGKETIIGIAKRINAVQEHHQVLMSSENDDFESRSRFGLMEVVYEWAKGMSFSQITDLTDVLEGTIVRVITRLDETCREVKSAARIIGDPSLYAKMQECQELIKRDVCHCASLYLVYDIILPSPQHKLTVSGNSNATRLLHCLRLVEKFPRPYSLWGCLGYTAFRSTGSFKNMGKMSLGSASFTVARSLGNIMRKIRFLRTQNTVL